MLLEGRTSLEQGKGICSEQWESERCDGGGGCAVGGQRIRGHSGEPPSPLQHLERC